MEDKTKTSHELQAEIERVASDLSRDQIGEVIEAIKAPRKIINDFVVKHSEFVKALSLNDTNSAVQTCGTVVSAQYSHLQSASQQLLKDLEHWRWTVDERIAFLRRQEALAKDKYGNERKPLELSPEEQELAYDLRGAAMRDSFEQTHAIERELKVTRMLQRARQEIFDNVNQPLSSLSRNSLFKLISWYKKQLAAANNRAQVAEDKLAAHSENGFTTRSSMHGKGDISARPKTAASTTFSLSNTVGPADIKHYQEKLSGANKEIDYLRKRLTDAEREADFTRSKLAGSESVIERLAKIANRERQKSIQLDREITRMAETGLTPYGVQHRTYSEPPPLLPTTTGDSLTRK